MEPEGESIDSSPNRPYIENLQEIPSSESFAELAFNMLLSTFAVKLPACNLSPFLSFFSAYIKLLSISLVMVSLNITCIMNFIS